MTVRDKLAESQAYLKVLKNTLALIAAREVFSDTSAGPDSERPYQCGGGWGRCCCYRQDYQGLCRRA
ncbi:MAG: hypothetical protein U5N58_12865 [Actinomycetota bacterium]|nr:hypothetical protein [Actinomycetota bacterium]